MLHVRGRDGKYELIDDFVAPNEPGIREGSEALRRPLRQDHALRTP